MDPDDGLKNCTRRTVYQHDFDSDPNMPIWDASEHHNIDTPVAVLEAHATKQWRCSVSMPRDCWGSLDDDLKRIWDQLPDSQKAIILGIAPSSSPRGPSPGQPVAFSL